MGTLTVPALRLEEVSIRTRGWTDSRRESDLPWGRSRAYVFLKGESLMDDLLNRRSRPYKAWRPLVADALSDLEVSFDRLRWSQRCGCSCPCSPGFIIDGPGRGKDYYLTVQVGAES